MINALAVHMWEGLKKRGEENVGVSGKFCPGRKVENLIGESSPSLSTMPPSDWCLLFEVLFVQSI
jgi:hypothetical protein